MALNTTDQRDAECTVIPGSESEKIILVLANVVIMLLALFGNALILYVFRTSRRTKNTTDIFIANLAVADLIFTILAIPNNNIVSLYIGPRRWLIQGKLGNILCKGVPFLQDASTAASVFTIILITIDRFIAVSRPFRGYTLHHKTSVFLVIFSWLIGVSVHGVYLKKYSLLYDGYLAYPECTLVWDERESHMYFVGLSISFAVLPLCLIVILYTIIFISLRRQQRRIGISLSDPQNVQRSMRQRKILYLSFAIVVSFVICWAPMNFASFLIIFRAGDLFDECALLVFIFFGGLLAHSSPAVNPIITFIFSTKFRGALREIFRRWKRKKKTMRSANMTTNIELN